MTARAECIAWWELRRVPFNVVVGICGFVTIIAILEFGTRLAPPGEDFIESILLMPGAILYGLAANAFYTLGWLSELLWSRGDPSITAPRRNVVFRAVLMVVLWISMGAPPQNDAMSLGH